MKSTPALIAAQLKHTPLFGALPDERLAEVALATRERRYASGELVFQKGDRPTGLYVIVAGKIKEACQSPDGEERIIEILGPQQICGEAALLLDCPYPFFVATLARSQLLHIEHRAIHALIDHEPGFVNRLLLSLSSRMYGIVRDIEAYSLKTPLQRLVGFLVELWSCADDAATGTNITLPVAKSIIASRLGMTPEALSRAFRDLADAGLLEVRGNQVTVHDMMRLREFGQ